jgi:hypothetical protein
VAEKENTRDSGESEYVCGERERERERMLFCFVFVLIIIKKIIMDWAAWARAQACRAASPPMAATYAICTPRTVIDF